MSSSHHPPPALPDGYIDHQAVAFTRLAKQYQESDNFKSYLFALLDYSAQLELLIAKVDIQLDIDIAEGVNLDAIGEIVGISRIVPESVPLVYFGFDDSIPDAGTYGEEGYLAIGSKFRNERESPVANSSLDDAGFRILIRAKIIKNHSHGTGEDLIKVLQLIYQTNLVLVFDTGKMSFNIAIGRELSFAEKALLKLDILPRPAGVLLSQRSTFDPTNYFGFLDQPGSFGFDIGIFSEEF